MCLRTIITPVSDTHTHTQKHTIYVLSDTHSEQTTQTHTHTHTHTHTAVNWFGPEKREEGKFWARCSCPPGSLCLSPSVVCGHSGLIYSHNPYPARVRCACPLWRRDCS